MKYFSMFTGIGGFEVGIERAFYNVDAHIGTESKSQERSQGGERPVSKQGALFHLRNGSAALCVGYSEIDKSAIQTYERHFKHENYGDATTIDETKLPDFDLIVGGFPCQSFSIAGKRGGFNDTRGTLFFDIARILKHKRPRHLVLENVKGLLNHDGGKTFATILGVLTDLGYHVEWQLLNSKDFGVPQNRERIYIVGHLGNRCRKQIFPIINTARTYSQELSATTIDANYWKGIDNHGARTAIAIGTFRTHKDGEGFREMKSGVAPTLPARARNDGSGQAVIAYEDMTIRRLTPVECERLQGFPDGWTAGQSDTQRYKQCCNAVTTNTVQAVMEKLFSHE